MKKPKTRHEIKIIDFFVFILSKCHILNNMKVYKFILLIILILQVSGISGKNVKKLLSPGQKAPKFVVETHDGKKITNKHFKGVYYLFIFEGKNGEQKNNHVRIRVENFIRMLPEKKRKKITFFSVADVSGYISLIRGIIRSKIQTNEKEQNVRIYCDFSGHILKKFQLKEDFTNFVLVDNKGVVKFIQRGVVSVKKLKEITRYLVNEFAAPYVKAPIDISPAFNSAGYKERPVQRKFYKKNN